jgi:hypothetical protein
MRDKQNIEESRVTPEQVDAEVKLIEARTKTAKEQASKKIGLWGMPTLIVLVGMGIGSSLVLPSEALPAVIGLVSTVAMATINMLQGITGTKEESEKQQAEIMRELITGNQQQKQPTEISVGKKGVSVSSSEMKLTTEEKED